MDRYRYYLQTELQGFCFDVLEAPRIALFVELNEVIL